MIYRLIIFIALLLGSITTAYSELIDIGKLPVYAKKGFLKEWLVETSPDNSWIYIAPTETGRRSIKVKNINFKGIPERTFLSLKNIKDEEFTFITHFSVPDTMLKNNEIPGMFLATIGENWEIYLNGKLLKSEMYRSEDGSVYLSRFLRRVCVPIHPQYLKEKDNVLAFRIVGNPWSLMTGFYRSEHYFIGPFSRIHEEESEVISLVLIFLYLFIGFYHIFLYFNRRKDVYNLSYGCFSVIVFVYFLSRTFTITTFILDSSIVQRIEMISLFAVIPTFGSFLDVLVEERLSIFTRILSAICGIFILASFMAPIPFIQDLVTIWQYTIIVPVFYYIIMVIGRSFGKNVLYLYRIYRSRKARFSFLRSLVSSLLRTVPGNLLLGVLIAVSGMFYDIIDALYFSTGIIVSRYSFLILTIGVMLILTNRFQSIFHQNEILNINLHRNIMDLNDANAMIRVSEEKYRSLVEETKDLIFSLDDKYNFITVNRNMGRILGISLNDFKSMNFLDILYDSSDERALSLHLIKEKMEELLRDKRSVQFKSEFKSAFRIEPIEMHVRLEYIGTEGKHEILGKAIYLIEDVLAKSFVSEEQKYTISNSLVAAEELSRRITRNLTAYVEHKQVPIIRLAVREMIVNAIEHGNLDISFNEKTVMVQEKKYMKLISERQNDERYRNKKVTVHYSIDDKQARYVIIDEGNGFDHQSFMKEENLANQVMLPHGRGILMARSIFDEIVYNETGNEVTLVKHFDYIT
jgi:PAS domain S-box-containing protein